MWRVVAVGVAIAAVMLYLSAAGQRSEERQARAPGTAGTSGFSSGVIHELETITGSNDGHELVGRRVHLHVPVQQAVNDVAFWVGSPDNRLLVVLARDTRSGAARQRGEASAHGIAADHEGQMATVSGTVQVLPREESMFSWGLTDDDRDELLDRRIYLRADTVTPHFAATTEAERDTPRR